MLWGKDDAVEDITNDNKTRQVVKLGHARKRDVDSPERGILMASDKAEILALLPLLTEEEQAVILGSIKSLLSEQESSAAAPVSIGQ